METKAPLKQFWAVSYDNQPYHFIITEENKIYCCEFYLETGADIIEIKPNFVLRNKQSETIYSLNEYLQTAKERPNKIKFVNPELDQVSESDLEKQQKNLIGYYIIEPSVLEYMIENKMILYSTDMAMLYRLNPEYAYDSYFQTRSFKNTKKKETKILTKQKKGIFR